GTDGTVAPARPRREQGRCTVPALVDVGEGVCVAGIERLARIEEDACPVGRGTVEEGVDRAIAAGGAGREPVRGRSAHALVDVLAAVGILADQRFGRLEEDTGAVEGRSDEQSIERAVAAGGTGRDSNRGAARAVED